MPVLTAALLTSLVLVAAIVVTNATASVTAAMIRIGRILSVKNTVEHHEA